MSRAKRRAKVGDRIEPAPTMFDARPLDAPAPPATDHEPYDLTTGELLGDGAGRGLAVPATAAANRPDPEPFAAWLLEQARLRRDGPIGDLAKMAKADPAFPKKGSAEDVRKRIGLAGADGDAFEALDDAEREYDRLIDA